VVTLSSSNDAARVPSSVTLPTGTSSATFPVKHQRGDVVDPGYYLRILWRRDSDGVLHRDRRTELHPVSIAKPAWRHHTGSGGTATVTVTPLNGFSGSVSLSVSGLPSGVSASFSPNPATTTSTMTLAPATQPQSHGHGDHHRYIWHLTRTTELDPASETSINLLRCLLADLGLNPCLVQRVAGAPAMRSQLWSVAHNFSSVIKPSTSDKSTLTNFPSGTWQTVAEFVGLPFVYALWLIRPEVADPKTNREPAARLCAMQTLQSRQLGRRSYSRGRRPRQRRGIDREFLSRYYTEHLRFGLRKKKRKVCESSQISA